MKSSLGKVLLEAADGYTFYKKFKTTALKNNTKRIPPLEEYDEAGYAELSWVGEPEWPKHTWSQTIMLYRNSLSFCLKKACSIVTWSLCGVWKLVLVVVGGLLLYTLVIGWVDTEPDSFNVAKVVEIGNDFIEVEKDIVEVETENVETNNECWVSPNMSFDLDVRMKVLEHQMNTIIQSILQETERNQAETYKELENIKEFVQGALSPGTSTVKTNLLSKINEVESNLTGELVNVRTKLENSIEHFQISLQSMLKEEDIMRIINDDVETNSGGANWIAGVSNHSPGYKDSFLSYFSILPTPRSPKSTFARKSCWPMEGSQGFIQYELQEGVLVRALTLEHIPYSQRTVFGSVPKDLRIEGSPNRGKTWLDLGSYVYDSQGPAVQYFDISYVQKPITTVKLIISSNYGEKFTCLYGVTVQGDRIEDN